jgi:pimeloyl-ACP methyl ester carboxylesterase
MARENRQLYCKNVGHRRVDKQVAALMVIWLALFSGHLAAQQPNAINNFVQKHFPHSYAEQMARFGLKQQSSSDSISKNKTIVLVHGLDDPGKVWMNLQPALLKQGYDIWRFEYPDDQPIHESARLLYQALVKWQVQLGSNIEIIAHSMGGLVSREMLTHPNFSCTECQQQRPMVDRLIMIGTPNAGSELARFRYFSEIRDQIFSGDFHWLGGFVDGNGEAGEELIPGSPFLTQLNSRRHPAETEYVIIAGLLTTNELAQLTLQLEPIKKLNKKIQQISQQVIQQLGDGLVSLDSAALAGVPLYKVTGTHLTIIRNVFKNSQRVPPAIPLIDKLLRQQKSSH